MRFGRTLVFTFAIGICAPAGVVAQQDLRVAYATDSLEAVSALLRGVEEAGAGRRKEAVVQFEEALRHDPKCGAAWFQIAYTHGQAGQTDSAIAAYKKVLADDMHASQGYRALAAVNVGSIYRRLGKLDESNLWYTRAALEEHDNRYRER